MNEQMPERDRRTLAPCPFCGGAAEFERMGTRRQSCIVACCNCNTRHESSDEGVDSGSSWNRRAQASNEPLGAERAEPRFFIDHGVIHDRVTGLHVHGDAESDAYGVERELAELNALDKPRYWPEFPPFPTCIDANDLHSLQEWAQTVRRDAFAAGMKRAAAPSREPAVWASHGTDSGMRVPELSDLSGGETDCAPSREPEPALADVVRYVARWGGNCRDCADENGVCPSSGLPCGGARKAIKHVIKALQYGVQHGYIVNPLAQADEARGEPAAPAAQGEPVAELRAEMKGGGYVHWLSDKVFEIGTKLYTAQPAAEAQDAHELTDDQLRAIALGAGWPAWMVEPVILSKVLEAMRAAIAKSAESAS